jgi:hypothetical protein
MARRSFALLVAIALGGWSLAAVERARGTFILTNGERVSGLMAYHGGLGENLINDHLNIAVDGEARERTIPTDQVALIEFVGGTPGNAELSALPANPAHLLVMRNNDTKVGHFVNMINGEILKWQDGDRGPTRDVPLRDVARIYLNADNARRIYNFTAPRTAAGNNVAPVIADITTVPGEMEVQANVPWSDTGLVVRRGDQIMFSVRGQIAFGTGPTQRSGADGDPNTRARTAPMPNVGVGALIGRIGNSAPFGIGNQKNALTMPASGRLFLAVNDDNYSDNSGAYRVTITRR